MSWLFSQALVEAFSVESSLGGEPSAQSNATPMPPAYLLRDKMTDAWRRFPSGMTCEPLTESHGEALLTSYLAGFHAKTSQQQGREQASKESEAGFGKKWQELSVKYDRNSHSWKTHHCLFDEDLPPSSVTLPKWGMMRNGVLYQQQMPSFLKAVHAHITCEKESGLSLPTVFASDAIHSTNLANLRRSTIKISVMAAHGMLRPTPTARDWKDNGKSPAELARNSETLAIQAGGPLNPLWVEWLMGWPIGWTELKPLEMGRFQQWQHSHGIS
jgi:hypothetical protein